MAYSVDCQGLIDGCSDPSVAVSCVLAVQPRQCVGQPGPQWFWAPGGPPCVYLFLCAGWSEKWAVVAAQVRALCQSRVEGGVGVVVVSGVGGG